MVDRVCITYTWKERICNWISNKNDRIFLYIQRIKYLYMDKFNLEIDIWNYINQFFWIFKTIFPDYLKNIAQKIIGSVGIIGIYPIFSELARLFPSSPDFFRLYPNLLEHSILRISLIHIRFRLFDRFVRNIGYSEIFFPFCVYPLSYSKHVLFKAIKAHENIHIKLLIRRQDTEGIRNE